MQEEKKGSLLDSMIKKESRGSIRTISIGLHQNFDKRSS